MNKADRNEDFSKCLDEVIFNLKRNIPIYTTLKILNYNSNKFYKLIDSETKEYLQELRIIYGTKI